MNDHAPQDGRIDEINANINSLYEMLRDTHERIAEIDTKLDKLIEQKGDNSLIEEQDIEDLIDDARKVVIEAGKASTSFIQRKLRIGYSKAAALLNALEEEGTVGPQEGAATRKILKGQ